jgi:uncharacterized protein (TIGR03435 family)
MPAIPRSVFLALVSVAAWGQTGPVFQAVSIKPSIQAEGPANVGVHIEGAQIACASLSLKEYIRMASRLMDYQIVGPDWLASDKFDVTATLPAGATREQVPAMTLALLTARFGLKFHNGKKEFPVYALVTAAGGLKMKASAAAGADDADTANPGGGRGGLSLNLGNGANVTFADNRFTGRRLTMANLADALGHFMDKPVVDMTAAQGRYDMTLALAAPDFRIMLIRSAVAAGAAVPPQALKALDNPLGDSLSLALEKLGLRLDSRNAPLEVLVVDHMEQAPTAN